MPRYVFIGDVHGCLEELQELIAAVGINSQDTLCFMGDLIDRGPYAAQTVKYVFQCSKQYKVVLLLGNHESKFFRYLNNKENYPEALKEMRGIDEFPPLLAQLTTDELAFLKSSYYNYYIPELNVQLVHGGIPKVTVNFFQSNKFEFPPSREKKHFELLTMARYINAAGHHLAMGEEGPSPCFWADTYQGNVGKVFFGHQPFIGTTPKYFPHAIGIDTGCVYGGYLTAYTIDADGTEHFFQVKAKREYAVMKKTS